MQKETIDLIERLQEGCYNHAARLVHDKERELHKDEFSIREFIGYQAGVCDLLDWIINTLDEEE